MTELGKALLAFQAELPRITKGQSSHHGKYADLPHLTRILLPLLNKNGLVWSCWPQMGDGEPPQLILRYRLIHPESGEEEAGVYPLPSSTPQTMGGAITYARRYCLCAVTGAAADDDDDAEAAQKEAETERDRKHQRPPRRPLPAPANADEPGTIASTQRSAIMAKLSKMDRDARLGIISEVIGREVESTNDLSRNEATDFLRRFHEAPEPPEGGEQDG